MTAHNTPPEVAAALECGCSLTFDTDEETGTLAWLVPCSELHRTVARLARKPGSKIVVCQVPA